MRVQNIEKLTGAWHGAGDSKYTSWHAVWSNLPEEALAQVHPFSAIIDPVAIMTVETGISVFQLNRLPNSLL